MGAFQNANLSVQSVTNTFFWPNTNTECYLVFRSHQIPNIEYYPVLRKSEFGIQIVLIGLTIWTLNTKYWKIYNFLAKKATKINIFVSYKTFCSKNLLNYLDRYLDRYRIQFGIEIIWIPNMNTVIRANHSNSIWIPNYLSQPACHRHGSWH